MKVEHKIKRVLQNKDDVGHVALYFVMISNSSKATPCNNLQRHCVNPVGFTSQSC